MPEIVWQILPYLRRISEAPGGSEAAAEVSALFAEMRPALLRYLYSFGVPVADGEDVVQETFLQLFHHLRAGKPRDNLRGWVFRVARNLALKQRERSGPEAVDWTEAVMVDPGPNPEEYAAQEGALQRVQAVVRALPERDRQCLFLRAEGMRYREIAEALEMSLGSVAASLSRSLGKLANVYER